MDADASWKVGGGVDAHDSGSNDNTSGAALHGWRAKVLVGLAVAAVAMCLWALVESILSTRGSAGNFWSVIDDAKQQVTAADSARPPSFCCPALLLCLH